MFALHITFNKKTYARLRYMLPYPAARVKLFEPCLHIRQHHVILIMDHQTFSAVIEDIL